MSRQRRSFDREIRDGAVRTVNETGRPVAHVARELGVCERMLGDWVREDRTERAAGCRRIDEGLFAHAGCLADRGGVVRRQREPVAGQHPVHGGVRHRACLHRTDAEPLEGGQLAVPPALPVSGQRLGVGLDGVPGQRGPGPLRGAGRRPPPIPCRTGDPRDLAEPGDRYPRPLSEGVELAEAPYRYSPRSAPNHDLSQKS